MSGGWADRWRRVALGLAVTGLGAVTVVGAAGATRGATRAATASAPASRPAAATVGATTRGANVIQADAILKFFPANAGSLASRSDARNFTVEGRVREVRTETLANGTTDLKVILVGRAQADEASGHFTCHIDKASEDDAKGLKPDQVVRLTGAIGTIAATADRIELKACHDITVTGTVNAGEQLAGVWRYASVQMDGTAQRKDNQMKGVRGPAAEAVPDGPYASPNHLDVTFKPDNTLVAELANKDAPPGQVAKRVTGRWTVVKDSTSEAQVKLDVVGMASVTVTAMLEGKTLKMNLPGFADKFLMPEMSFGRPDTPVQAVDWRALRDQTLRWVDANAAPAQNQLALKYFSDLIVQAQTNNGGFAMSVGAGMLKRNRATYVVGLYGKMLVLEYSDAENQLNAGARLANNGTVMPQWGALAAAEVKVESFVVDNQRALDTTKPVTGKVTLRSLRRPVEGQYTLVLILQGGMSMVGLNAVPGSDAETYNFSFPPLPRGSAQNPRVGVFVVGRSGRGGDLFGDQGQRVVAEPIGVLLDIAK